MDRDVFRMKKKWLKIVLPIGILAVGLVGMQVISATAPEAPEKAPLDKRPTVKVEELTPTDYHVNLRSYGEVQPLEETRLSAQVSGEVTNWHPHFLPGGLVKRGDILFTIEKDAYEAALLRAEAELSQAKANLIEELARADVAEKEARNLPKSQVSDLYLRKPQVLSARAAVSSAEAAVKLAQRDLRNCEVEAPFDALVVSRNVGVGQFVSMGAQVAELSNVEHAEVVIPIAGFDTQFLPETLDQQQATLSIEGFEHFERKGTIVRDLGIVDELTRMSQLVVRVSDPYALNSDASPLKFGSYVEVSFKGKELQNVFRIRQELVANSKVWTVEDEKLVSKPVTVLREEDQYFFISEGLQPDDKLVLTLPEYPQSGMPVKLAGKTQEIAATASK